MRAALGRRVRRAAGRILPAVSGAASSNQLRPLHTGPDTTEFRREFARETERLLRRRLLWFVSIWGGLGVLSGLPDFVVLAFRDSGVLPGWVTEVFTHVGEPFFWLFVSAYLAWSACYAGALFAVLRFSLGERALLRISLALVAVDGILILLTRAGGVSPALGMGLFILSHSVASAMFPWTWSQALRPVAIVSVASVLTGWLITREADDEIWGDVIASVATPVIGLPGVLICLLRHSRRLERFGYRFLEEKYGRLRQELNSARIIQQSLFPHPVRDGAVRMVFRYEPMRQIGGDFLYASRPQRVEAGRRVEEAPLSVVLLDVTGHGIPAALTVSRLHGEIDLMYAANPLASPAEVLGRLNHHVHLTLSRHSIYVTGVCARVDPIAGTLEYASAGHPPAFLVGSDGTLEELESTTLLLGVAATEEFEAGVRRVRMGPGDALIAYTDGATEARNHSGRMLRTEGLRDLVRGLRGETPGERAERLLRAVAAHRDGRAAEDDTLIVEVYRPVG